MMTSSSSSSSSSSSGTSISSNSNSIDIISSNDINTIITNDRKLDNSNNESSYTPSEIALSIFLFIIAGIFEVGGGYLVWKGIREKIKPILYIIMGSIVLVIYGFIPTLQPIQSFGRTFAIYGGFFIVLSYCWGAYFDGMKLDTGDYVGAAIALGGVLICWLWPRN